MKDIIFNNVSRSFGDREVLSNLNLILQGGKNYCIMGASGRGKTTLLNLILGLLSPDSGEILNVPDSVSAVFQEDRLSEPFSAVANVLAVTGKRIPVSEIESCLAELGLKDSEYLPVSQLSGGMRRRAAIARALLNECELLVLDEPFKGLDDKLRETVIKVILNRSKGKTLVVATHDIRDAELLNAEIIDL